MKSLKLETTGPLIATSADASNLIGAAWGRDVDTLIIPVARLHSDFFDLSTGLAGEVLQKLTLHGLKLVVLGDISAQLEKSAAFRDFVREANRGNHARFVNTEQAL